MKEYTVKVDKNGTKEWYLNGKRHREDGPAYISESGNKQWYLNGKLHREDGPAAEWEDGTKQWFLNDKQYSEKEFLKQTQPAKELTIAEIEALLGHRIKVVK